MTITPPSPETVNGGFFPIVLTTPELGVLITSYIGFSHGDDQPDSGMGPGPITGATPAPLRHEPSPLIDFLDHDEPSTEVRTTVEVSLRARGLARIEDGNAVLHPVVQAVTGVLATGDSAIALLVDGDLVGRVFSTDLGHVLVRPADPLIWNLALMTGIDTVDAALVATDAVAGDHERIELVIEACRGSDGESVRPLGAPTIMIDRADDELERIVADVRTKWARHLPDSAPSPDAPPSPMDRPEDP